MPDDPGIARPGTLAAEALQRGKRLRRRRIVVRRGATSLALVAVVSVAVVLRFGSSQPQAAPAGPTTTSLPAVTTSTSTPPTTSITVVPAPPTVVHEVQAWTALGAVDPAITVTSRQTGSCFGGSLSIASGQSNEWRCTAGHVVFDPCISASSVSTAVLCLASPSSAVEVSLTSELPLAGADAGTGGAWILELADGQRCTASIGEGSNIDSVPLNYQCAGGTAGGVDSALSTWTARFESNGSTTLTTVAVTSAWRIAPAVASGVRACAASQLSATFAVEPGSNGAGHVVYVLQLRNTSQVTCSVFGLPAMQLLGSGGQSLPTNVQPDGSQPSNVVDVAPGGSAYSGAWFSPDVPGVGEPASGGQCEQTAASVAVSWTGSAGSLETAVAPATPVCEHGALAVTSFRSTYPTSA